MTRNRKWNRFVFTLFLALLFGVVPRYFRKDHATDSSKNYGQVNYHGSKDEILSAFFQNLRSMLRADWGSRGYCNNVLEFADWPICGDGIRPHDIRIYSFGIADDYDFEAAAGLHGFPVYAFDPTRNYPQKLAKNVNFFNCGLRGELSKNWSHSIYGDTVGGLLSLPEILKLTNLKDTEKLILKLDCEGCEWEAFSLLKKHPNILNRVLQVNIEMHFTTSLRVNNYEIIERMKETYILLSKCGFVPWFIFPQGGSRSDRNHLKLVLENGFPENICCYEIGFIRNPAPNITRNDVVTPRRKIKRPESVWKWGQIWGNSGIEYIKHSELSKGGRGLSIIKSLPSTHGSVDRKENTCSSPSMF